MSIKILFIDDDKSLCSIANNIFSILKNIEFKTISTDDEFYEFLSEIEISKALIDILIIDIRFTKKLSGIQIIEKLKEKKLVNFIIVISGYIEETTLIKLINLGVDKFFEKPVNWREFIGYIKRIIPIIIEKKQKSKKSIKYKYLEANITIENDLDNILPVSYWCVEELVDILPDTRINSLVVGLSEIITNAMEHGNLGITPEEKQRLIIEGKLESEFKKRAEIVNKEKKYVNINKKFYENYAIFIIEDNGKGFLNKEDIKNLYNTSTYFGRGLYMVKIIFDELSFENNGSKVILKVHW
ncbi:MAG: response regulator [Spirochaetes bacterium]|nr:response regulator [Spirochaetota bacterium]